MGALKGGQDTGLNPSQFDNYIDEDCMGKIAPVTTASHASHFMRTWTVKYMVKKSMRWREMKRKPRNAYDVSHV